MLMTIGWRNYGSLSSVTSLFFSKFRPNRNVQVINAFKGKRRKTLITFTLNIIRTNGDMLIKWIRFLVINSQVMKRIINHHRKCDWKGGRFLCARKYQKEQLFFFFFCKAADKPHFLAEPLPPRHPHPHPHFPLPPAAWWMGRFRRSNKTIIPALRLCQRSFSKSSRFQKKRVQHSERAAPSSESHGGRVRAIIFIPPPPPPTLLLLFPPHRAFVVVVV